MSALPIEVQIPDRDTPRARSVALVGAIAMLAGLGIAGWGMESERGTGAAITGTGTNANANAGANANADVNGNADGNADGNANTNANANANANTNANTNADTGTNANADANANTNANTNANANADANTNANANAGTNANANTAPPAPAAGAGAPLRVRRGRVAYLRCDGLRTCPRDERLEAAVWPILDGLAACATAPTAPGEADIRLDYGAGAPEIAWRDTFPDDTVRLDRERVLGCLQAPLAATRQSVGAERLLVSFRFALVAR